MKKIKLIFAFSLYFATVNQNAFSQTVEYSYDANGNRVQRKLVVIGPNPNRETPKDSTKAVKAVEESKQVAMKYGVTVYPNTTSDAVNVAITKPKGYDDTESNSNVLYLLDNNGRILLKQQQSTLETKVDLSQYKAGIYYIRILFRDESLFYKVIKVD